MRDNDRITRRKAIAAGALLFSGTATGVSFANSSSTSSISVSSGGSSSDANIIPSSAVDDSSDTAEFTNAVSNTGSSTPDTKSVADSDLRYGTTTDTAPSWSVSADTGGGVSYDGDVFLIENLTSGSELFFELFYNNVGDLSDNYNYLNLDVELYHNGSGNTLSTETLTLSTGRVTFTDTPSSTGSTGDFYSLAISTGSWYTKGSIDSDTSNLTPEFYLNVDQA